MNEVRTEPTADEQVAKYLEIRDLIKELDEAHAKKLEPLREIQERAAGWLQEFMERTGIDAVKTKHGTAYTTTKFSASLPDPEAFMQFVVANKMFELLDRKANLTAVKDYVQENKTLPPGCNLSSVVKVNVRIK